MADATTLSISKFIQAPPTAVWTAWSKPEHLAQWWIPEPYECKVAKLDLKPGGGFETLMREGDGEFQPHVEGCFLDIVPEKRMVWTTALAEGWRPIEPWLALTATIEFHEQDGGTLYSARVQHRSPDDSKKHEELGFHEGWGTVIDQLASYLKRI
jgi:uncharacterized protein YndB with AHSA1/START domain